MRTYFVTENVDKLTEVQALLPHVLGYNLPLPEIQSLSPEEVVKGKIATARSYVHKFPVIADDTALFLDCFGGRLPGPYIKSFLEVLGPGGLYREAALHDNYRALAVTVFGYGVHWREQPDTFRGELWGTIVPPRGAGGFGFDSIFQPEGYTQTLAEMTLEEKNKISSRRMALEKLVEFLRSHNELVEVLRTSALKT